MKRSWLGGILLDPKAEAGGNGSNNKPKGDAAGPDDGGLMTSALSKLGVSAELMADFGGEGGEGSGEGEGEGDGSGEGEGDGQPEGEGEGDGEGGEGSGEGEGEGDGSGEGEGDGQPEGEGEGDGSGEGEGEGEAGAAPELNEEQKAWVDAQLAEANGKVEKAEKAVEELTGLVASLRQNPVAVADVHPLMLADDLSAIAKEEKAILEFEKWALENWDGTDEIPAEGDRKAVPAYSKDQIRKRYAEVKEIRETIIPKAKQNLQYRAQWDAVVKNAYPALLDSKSKDYQILEAIIRQAPGLKAIFPNYKVIIGDAMVGEKVRLEKAKARRANGGKTPVKPAPKVPVKPSPASRTKLAPQPKADRGISVTKFMQAGGDRNALVNMIAASDLVNQ